MLLIVELVLSINGYNNIGRYFLFSKMILIYIKKSLMFLPLDVFILPPNFFNVLDFLIEKELIEAANICMRPVHLHYYIPQCFSIFMYK